MPFAEDLTPFFNPAEFAHNATLDGVAVVGVFDAAYDLQDIASGLAATGPVYLLPTASVPALPVGKLLVCNATTYKVVETLPDGTGVTQLRLRT